MRGRRFLATLLISIVFPHQNIKINNHHQLWSITMTRKRRRLLTTFIRSSQCTYTYTKALESTWSQWRCRAARIEIRQKRGVPERTQLRLLDAPIRRPKNGGGRPCKLDEETIAKMIKSFHGRYHGNVKTLAKWWSLNGSVAMTTRIKIRRKESKLDVNFQ